MAACKCTSHFLSKNSYFLPRQFCFNSILFFMFFSKIHLHNLSAISDKTILFQNKLNYFIKRNPGNNILIFMKKYNFSRAKLRWWDFLFHYENNISQSVMFSRFWNHPTKKPPDLLLFKKNHPTCFCNFWKTTRPLLDPSKYEFFNTFW